MMQGSDWPMPTAPRVPETPRERIVRVLPAVTITLALHALMAWWLLHAPAPWRHAPNQAHTGSAIEVEFLALPPPPPPPPAPTVVPTPIPERADAVPFPATRPTAVEAEIELRASPQRADSEATPSVQASDLFGDIAGVAAGMSRPDASRTPRGDTHLQGREQPFLNVGDVIAAPPPSPQKVTRAVVRVLLSTTGANSITDFMGATEGRDPGREIQRAHHADLYLPRGCDDPDDPNLSDECLGIEKR